MTRPLTHRALRIFAVLESYRAGSADILEAVMPFFEPLLAEIPVQTFNAQEFAARINEAYRWNFTSDIVEELLPRFEKKGWVKKMAGNAAEVAYQVTYQSQFAGERPEVGEIQITKTLLVLAEEFSIFIQAISPLTSFAVSSTTLADTLVEWLISIDAYTEDILREKALQVTRTEGTIGLTVIVNDSSSLKSEEKYLCARFVKFLFEKKSPYIADLCKLASVGLITEVVQDFHKPVTLVKRTNLTVYLDAPVALDLLGVSGKEAAANIRPLLQKLQEIGGTARIFRASVTELQGALDAVLRRRPTDRTGATAGAMRRGEVLEAYVREVARNPESFLTGLNVAIVERTLQQFPNDHEHFDDRCYDSLMATMTWHVEVSRREHDATIVAHVMRMRRGAQSQDIFQSRHLLITRNALLNETAKRFSVERGLIDRKTIGPSIHQRQLATAIWLRTGLSDVQEDIPRRYLLAACERVLELKTNVVDQVRIVSRSLTPEKAQQLDLLLTQDRSTQLLMDKTLGSSNVVNAHNIEPLIDEMARSLTISIEKDAENTIRKNKQEATNKVRKANELRRSAEQATESMSQTLQRSELEDEKIIDALIAEVNSDMNFKYRWVVSAAWTVIVLIALLPLLGEALSSTTKVITLCFAGLIAAIFGAYQLFDLKVGIRPKLISWAQRRVVHLANERQIKSKLDRFKITDDGKLLTRTPIYELN